ncbi:cysteine hydrolase [Candidatus Woesearchaeota archaeon]|nr:cysteine hydrolase [Candidatus Woesearchaeota archaeon]
MKTVFWNVDTQYDFMRNDETHKGKLPVEGARAIEGNLELLTKLAAREGMQVVNTADWHTYDDPEIDDNNPDFVNTFPMHCEAKTKGAEYVPATKPQDPYIVDCRNGQYDAEKLRTERNVQFYKNEFNIFTGNKLAEAAVDIIAPDRVIAYGVATNVCVDFAVMGNLERGREVYVVEDAVKELPHLPLDATMDRWKDAGAKFIKTAEVADYLR